MPTSLEDISDNNLDLDNISVDLSALSPCDQQQSEASLTATSIASDDSSPCSNNSSVPLSAEVSVSNPDSADTCEKSKGIHVPFPSISIPGVSKADLIKLQKADVSLKPFWDWADNKEKRCFVVDGILMCLTTTNGRLSHSVIVPNPLRNDIIKIAHDHSGHFGISATRSIINSHFTWPSMHKDIQKYIKSCSKCQLFDKRGPPKAPLVAPELIVHRFEKLAVDVVGPLVKSKSGFRYILTAMDLATSFPFAYPMKSCTANETAHKLLSIFSMFGPPVAILSDQGTNFMSKVLQSFYEKLAIQRISTSPYHPESNGKLERFHSTLKAVLRKSIVQRIDWPNVLELALFFLRNLPHSRSGFTPYELTFLKPTPHVLATLKSNWLSTEDSTDLPRFLEDLDSNVSTLLQSLKGRLRDSVVEQRAQTECRTLRNFSVGDLVWKRIPGLHSSLEASWEGPFVIKEKLSDVNYRIAPNKSKCKGKVVHINLLKDYGKHCDINTVVAVPECEADETMPVSDHRISSELCVKQRSSLLDLLSKHNTLFSDVPGLTNTVSHSITLTRSDPLWTPSYSIPAHLEPAFQKSVEELLSMDIIEPSTSPWSSPPIPIIKKDGDVRIVVDYRKLNSVTVPEPFQMPSVIETVSRLGKATFLSKLDLLKGFHQVPMSLESRKYTAFSCRHGKYHYKRMPFGLRNAPATFQLLMQEVLRGLEHFSSPYIDDIIIFSVVWDDHLVHINSVLERLSLHGLSVKSCKCCWGYKSFEFLGFIVGEGHLSIPQARVEQFRLYVKPKTVSQLRSFLGLANFYSKFVPRFADLSKVLTPHTSKNSPKNVVWNDVMCCAFDSIINAIVNYVELMVPADGDSLCIFVDASTAGVGGVLCVYRSNEWKPVSFYSKQLLPRESRYSATEIEALALLTTVEHFAYYLRGVEFTAFTDHKALVHLFESPKLNNRLWRWKLKLLDFNVRIVHLEGRLNVVADALSRQAWPASSSPVQDGSPLDGRGDS